MKANGIDVYIVTGNDNGKDIILSVFTDYPAAVKYAIAQEKSGWNVKIESWIAYNYFKENAYGSDI